MISCPLSSCTRNRVSGRISVTRPSSSISSSLAMRASCLMPVPAGRLQRHRSGTGQQYSIAARGVSRTPATLLSRDAAYRELAGARVGLHVERDLLAFAQRMDAGALERGGVDKHVLAAVVRLNETVAFAAVVELNCTCRHRSSF